MAWILLMLAGVEEVISVVAMKYVDGFKRKIPIIVLVVGFFFSVSCLAYAMKVIPVGVAYAVWAAMGAVGIALVGRIWFKEKLSKGQTISLSVLILGVIALRLTA